MAVSAARPIRTVAVIMAMRSEAEPLLLRLGATATDLPLPSGPLPFLWYEARVRGLNVVVSLNGVDRRRGVDGIATQPAVLNAYVTMLHKRPDLVISAGVAGGWDAHGTEIGDVFVSRHRFMFHDRRIPLDRFDRYGLGSYPSVDASLLARALNLKVGVVTTGNSLDESETDRRVISEMGAAVKDMEAAAVAYVADLLGVPMLAMKAVTAHIDDHKTVAEQFLANLALGSKRLSDAVYGALDWCEGRTIGDLGGRPAR